jgi:4-methylaminobutanoate oxidase (formaldehyde-forming)
MVHGVPQDFSFGEIEPDWERMGPYLEKAMSRVPISMEAGIHTFFCGPESFTPDLSPIVGEAPELANYFVAAGLNSIGILTGGGIGRLVANWIITGRPDMDVTGIHIDRLHPYQSNPEYRAERTVESLGMVYQCHYPTRSLQTARGAKKSPFHDRLAAAGAYFKDVSGWEGPDWYAPPGVEPTVDALSWGRQNWFPYWAEEHRATREDVVLMDMSFMSKFLVQGRDAGEVLNFISANNVDGACGRITYTQWLNEWGTLEADLTVTKLEEDRFMVVVSDTNHRHAETWMRRNTPEGAHAFVTDVTSAYAQINVQGPKSRALLQSLTTDDLSNQAFPFRTAREIGIGYARVLCVRITYLGELGFELYVPAEQATHVRPVRGRVGIRGEHEEARRLPGKGGPRRAPHAGGVQASARPGPGQGPRTDDVPRRGRAPERRRGRGRARRLLRAHPGGRRGAGHDRGRRPGGRDVSRRGHLGGGHRREEVSRRGFPQADVRPGYGAYPVLGGRLQDRRTAFPDYW